MKGTHVGLVFPSAHHRGGVERITWELAKHLSSRHRVSFVGHEIDLDGLEGVDHAVVARRLTPALQPLAFRHNALKALRQLRPDATVSLGANCPAGDVLVVNSVHRAWLEQGKAIQVGPFRVPNQARRLLARHQVLLASERAYFASPRPHSIIAVSDRVVDDLVRLYGVDRNRCHVIPNGYSSAQCSPRRRGELRADMRRELAIDEDNIALLFVANELHRKGFGVLLDAVGRLDDPRVHVHIVGRTAPDDFRGSIDRLGLSSNVHYHGATDDVGRFHAAADLFVLPTQYEAFALAIVEALASGVPVITTAVPGAGDLVEHGENGLVQQDPLDAAELAGLLTQALEPQERHRLGQSASESVLDYEWSVLMARAEKVIVGG